MSSCIDLTSVSWVTEVERGVYYVQSHSFAPEEKVETRRKSDKVPYDIWVRDGWITATEGAEIDYHEVLRYIVQHTTDSGWSKLELCYDAALATWLKQEAENYGFVPIDIPQTYGKLSEPTKWLRSKVYGKKVIHNNNPVLTWAVGNAVTRVGPSENILLDKGKSSDRIDPVASVVNACFRAMASDPKTTSIYETRGLRSLND